ncbi:MAG: hypothetical protein JWQ16_2284 [Novosphingobium sp.]|nr:hypothetical protein [Novosphingobium sp.]
MLLNSGFNVVRASKSFRPSLLKGCSLGVALATALTSAAPAFADGECGIGTAGTFICAAAVPYGDITYAPTGDLTLITNAGVVVNGTIKVDGVGATKVTNNGTVATSANSAAGIVANGTTSVVITGNGPISTGGSSADGISVNAGDVPVTIDVGNITTAGNNSNAVLANAIGDISVKTGVIKTQGDLAVGVLGRTDGGSLTVSTGDITTTGFVSGGVRLYAAEDISVTTGVVKTAGGYAEGVFAKTYNGAAVIKTGNVTTTGDNATGVSVAGVGAVTVTTADITTKGFDADAIIASSSAGAVVVTAGVIKTEGESAWGVTANSAGSATVTSGNVTTTGKTARGISAVSTNGSAAVIATNVTTTGADSAAIVARGVSAVVTSTGTVSASGSPAITSGTAITVTGTAGNATATVNNVSATGGTATQRALVVTATGIATATINGAATTVAGDRVVQLTGATTVATVAGSGSIIGSVNALFLGGTSGSSLTNAGSIVGGATGAAVTSAAGPLTLTNSGTIGSNANLALLAIGGPATVSNSGTINGYITLTAGNDTVTNTGFFNAPVNSDFGGGTDTFNNGAGGTLNIARGTAVPTAVTFAGLEAFNNNGTISLVNGHVGDTLTLPGTYVGLAGSVLAVDINASTATGDRLIVVGAATGTTGVVLNNISSTNAAATNGIVVATGGAGSSAATFRLANQSQNIGFINYQVVASAVAGGGSSFALVGTPGDSVLHFLKINEAAQALWYKSADVVSTHLSEVRDAKWSADAVAGGRVWGVMYGGVQTRDSSDTGSAFGLSRTVDTSYKQDAFGGQIGVDLGGTSGGSSLVFGLTGGYLNSQLTFQNTADRTSFDVVNGGVYASFTSGSLFANALAKYDHYWIKSRSPAANFSDRYQGNSYGAQGEIGMRFGSDTFYAEPVISGAYVQTDLDSPELTNAALDFDKLDGLRGKAGLRIGSAFNLGANRAVVYASGNAVHEFKGRQGLNFTSGGTTFSYRNSRIGTYGEGKIGLSIVSQGGVTGFVEGFGNYSSDYKGGGARAGLRIKL